ncbi:MAG: MFS transporter [Verrucomicrobiales bacterium]|nr:MFS transporter [Verrucomicrobiales bacterium]
MNTSLLKRGFLSLTVAQFFGAANDNLLKTLLVFSVASGGMWYGPLGEGGSAYVGLCLTIPFILLSGYAGQLADRYSKQKISRIVKLAEIGIALIAFLGFFLGNLWLALSAMLLLAIQSAFFGPAKYGLIPELVDDKDLCQANGFINMSTNIAVITGTLLAGPVYDSFQGAGGEASGSSASTIAMLILAVLGWGAILFMPKMKAMNPKLKFCWNPFSIYFGALKDMRKTHLLTVAIAWASFYMIGMMALLILPEYKDLLGITATKASYLMGIMGLAIGIGSVMAGFMSRKKIQPKLIPLGAAGMTVFFALLGVMQPEFKMVAVFIAGAGVFAGFYIIPLQALLQKLSPDGERGRFLGTANALSFACSTIGSLVFLLARAEFGMAPNRVFLICAGLAFLGTTVLLWMLTRLVRQKVI